MTLFCEHYTVQQHWDFHCLYHSDICALVFWDLSLILSACCIVELIGDDKCLSTDLFKTLNRSDTNQVTEWLIELCTQPICSKMLIKSETIQATEWLNESFTQSVYIKKMLIHDSLNHLLNQFVKKRWLIQEWNKLLSD